MAKRGLTFFQVDCVEQDNIEYVQLVHGIIGYGVFIKLLRRIYQNEGYYCEWNNKTMLNFSKKDVDVDIEKVKEIVATCLDEGIFDRGMYEKFGILTSDGIQKRWLKIVTDAKRKEKFIEPEHDLITIQKNSTPEETEKTPEYLPKTPEETEKTPEVLPHSIVEYSIVKNSKEEESKEENKKEVVFEILTNPVDAEKKEISLKILRDFGFNEITNQDKLRIITAALHEIITTNRLQYFSEQYRNYWQYKNLSGERTHNLQAFFADPPGWDSANWMEKLKNIQKPTKVDQYQSSYNEVINDIHAAAART